MVDFKKKLEQEEADKNQPRSAELAEEILQHDKKRRRLRTYVIALIVIALIFAGRIMISGQSTASWLGGALLNRIIHFSGDKNLAGEDEDRINILLLGMGGEGHDGAFLTDTIMLASLKPSSRQVALISFPRDLVTPVSNWQKINSINAYAEAKERGSGGEAVRQAMSELLQIPIQYYVRVDFNGFVNIIDELGGITVNVENVLNDYSYPIEGQENNPNYYARFEHLYFDKGPQTMNGSRALKFVRSRHALGIEGSDFARARRQQLVLEAVKNKLLSAKTLLNPAMIGRLSDELSKNISTNLKYWEVIRLWDLFRDVDRARIINKVLSDAPDNFLVAGYSEIGAYILTPRSGNFSAIRNLVQNIFLLNPPEDQESELSGQGTKVVVLNGTWISGLAAKTAATLNGADFSVILTANAPDRDRSKSLIYSMSQQKLDDPLKALIGLSGATLATDSPLWLNDYNQDGTNPDFIIILGTDANR